LYLFNSVIFQTNPYNDYDYQKLTNVMKKNNKQLKTRLKRKKRSVQLKIPFPDPISPIRQTEMFSDLSINSSGMFLKTGSDDNNLLK